MSLQDKLDARKKEFKASAPEDVQEIMHRATEELENSGIVEDAKGKGDPAPDFTLVNQHGESIRLIDRLAQGPVVLGFYRGRWWPYCNLELEALEEVNDDIRKLGATLMVASPQSEDHTRKFAARKGFTMDILVDDGNRVAEAFGLVFTLPEDLQKIYKKFGNDLAKYNADGSWNLPLAARYIIDRDGVIRYAEVGADYTVRPEPAETVAALRDILSS